MKTVIEMARDAGFSSLELVFRDGERLERFAALVREDFALKFSAEACGKCVIKQAYKDSEKELNALREISDKQGSFPEKNLSPVVCEHTNQSVTHYSNETWIQHCESCGVVIKSGTYINENGAVTNEVTTQQEPVAWSDDLDAMPFNAYCSAIVNWNSYSRDGDSFRKGTDVEVIVVKYKTNDGESAIEFLHTGDDQMLLTNCDVIKWKPLYTTPPTSQQEPVAWTHSCNALCVDGLELWVDQCPHCGKPRTNTTPPTSQQEPVAWYGLVMEAAAELELASYAIQQDSDSKRSALNAATWVREQAKKLRSANPPTAAQDNSYKALELVAHTQASMKAHAAAAARQIAAEIADFCSDIDGGENMFSRAIRKKYGVE